MNANGGKLQSRFELKKKILMNFCEVRNFFFAVDGERPGERESLTSFSALFNWISKLFYVNLLISGYVAFLEFMR